APVGTGMWIAGGNDNIVRNNRFWDNHRRGVMLFSAPDAMVCGPVIGSSTPVPGCNPLTVSTSYRNSFSGNVMGVAPSGEAKPNGVDFWWDAFPTNTGNCWWDNTAAKGKSVTTSPGYLPGCNNGQLPALSIGLGSTNEAELVACFVGLQVSGYPNGSPLLCDWTQTPPVPGTPQAVAIEQAQTKAFTSYCSKVASSGACGDRGQAAPTSKLAFASPIPLGAPPAQALRALGAYTCSDWNHGSAALRASLLSRLHDWVGGPVEGSRLLGFGSVLTDLRATSFFDQRCAPAYASGFALYKQYGQAAAFAGVAP
ncbi:MAG: right-handed parallel beta-helix repeat-containing protein, partial [Pseudolysinimonas sp.]